MEGFKGTKGEWVADENGGCKTIKSESGEICDTVGRSNESEDLANANLIAASPDLLELVLLVHKSFAGGNVVTFSESDIKMFNYAVNKALGNDKT